MTSLQDIDDYQSKQQSASGGFSFTFGSMTGSAGLSLSQSKVNSEYASVGDQSGLFAGNGGYDIYVGNHTQLNGAVIASTAESANNALSTGTLGWSDIDNHASYKASSSSISMGGGNGDNKMSGGAIPTSANAHGSASGTTRSAVADGAITVRNGQAQTQNVADLSRDTDNANGHIDKIFDKDKVARKLEFAQGMQELGQRVAGDISSYKMQAAESETKERLLKANPQLAGYSTEALNTLIVNDPGYKAVAEKWGTGGSYSMAAAAVTGVLGGLGAGNLGAAAAGGMAPYIANKIKQATSKVVDGQEQTNVLANTMAHAVAGAVLAQLAGNSATAGAAGAAGGELMARAILSSMYPGKQANDLTQDEKQVVSALGQLAAQLSAGVASGSVEGGVQGAIAGKNAVENNALSGLEGFGTGFQNNVQAQGSLVNNTNLTDENGKVLNPATPEQIKYASDKLVTGDMPAGQNAATGLLTAWGAGMTTVVAPVLLPATATVGSVIGAGAIGGSANVFNQLNSGGAFSATDALIATGISGLTQGKGFWFTEVASVTGAYTGAKLQGKDVVPVVAGAVIGTAIGAGGGKAVEIGNKYFPIVSDKIAGIAGAIGGSVISEATGSKVEDKLKNEGDNK